MLHETTLAPAVQILNALKGILAKAEAHAVARKIAPETLLFARLYPDMYHFTRQVQTTADFGMKLAARLTGREPVKLDWSEKTFDDLKALLQRAVDYVQATDTAAVEAMADKTVTFNIGERPVTMPTVAYAHRFAMPNFYFHASMAYAVLRENGVDLGKVDFIGNMKD